ncbi:MAG: uracil-DNA glycosylase [Pseudomonadota bacterium]|nr:uracil-DNA glycosylase [Pseudomonadota bacterium]
MVQSIEKLNEKIKNCVKCRRLVLFRKKIAKEKTKRFKNDTYWGKPVIGFGDKKAKIIVLGLAPAAHGGNRTGRVFTGDKSAEFLFKCLYKAKMSNQPYSECLSDGLILKNIYMTPALKCVPPNDKPTSKELINCFSFLKKEFRYLKDANMILALGKIAFDSCLKLFELRKSEYRFIHGKIYTINKKINLAACYHPSPRNVNTGRLNESMLINVLKKLQEC